MKKRDKARLLVLAVASIVCMMLGCKTAYAALAVEPENVELVVSAGKILTGIYNVSNEGNGAVHVTVQLESWPRSSAASGVISVEKWLTVTPLEFDLAPQEHKEVKYAIDPPGGPQGEVAAMIFFATTAPEGAMNITTRDGVSLYAALAENMRLECVIDKVSVDKFEQKTDSGMVDRGIVFTISIENKGNVHLRPTGFVTITGNDGTRHELNIERGFPAYVGGKESYQVLWDKKDIIPGKYEALVTLDYGKLYNQDKKLEKKVSFAVKDDGSIAF